MEFDNHDERIRYVELALDRFDLEGIAEPPLPQGYRFVLYQPGDREHWIAIEQSAKELVSHEQGLRVWADYYAAHEASLPQRMFFIENPQGEKVATATAFFDVKGIDPPSIGYLHWVAVRRDHQGLRLARPLIAHTLLRLRDLGYTHVRLHTQTTTWLACKLYLDFGFRPTADSARTGAAGWRIVKALTHHPALADVPEAAPDEIIGG